MNEPKIIPFNESDTFVNWPWKIMIEKTDQIWPDGIDMHGFRLMILEVRKLGDDDTINAF